MKNQYVGDIFDRERVPKQFGQADPAIKNILLEPVPGSFSVCKVQGYTEVDLDQPFVFTGTTDEEKSLVCPITFSQKKRTMRRH